jgi:hypothetical protein
VASRRASSQAISPERSTAGLRRSFASSGVGLGRGEPGVELALLRLEPAYLFLELRPLRDQGFPRIGTFLASLRLRTLDRFTVGRVVSRDVGVRPSSKREHPVAVVVEVAVERRDPAAVDEQQRVGRRGEQVAIVRDDDERAVEILQRLGERLAHLDVEVVGRLVEDQELRPATHDQREHQARFLAAGEARDRRLDHVAAEVEAAEEVAQLLLARARIEAREVQHRRRFGVELLELVLREVADAEVLRDVARPVRERELAGERLDERRLARAVGAEQADAVAGEDRQLERAEHRRRVAVAQRRVLEPHELARVRARRREHELERAVDVRRRDALHALERPRRLCACFALVAFARKRSTNDCRCSIWRCCFANADCCNARCAARSRSNDE